MHYSVLRLRDVRMAAVLVEKARLQDEGLIERLQRHFALPVMLVARDDGAWNGVRARAQFEAAPYLFALVAAGDIEWSELEELSESRVSELPF